MQQCPADELLALHGARCARASPRAAPSPAPLAAPDETRARVFCCWLCETPCEGAGWLSAPELYGAGGHAGMGVTGLTLCTRCSAACALRAEESHEAVMRCAGATRALTQRSEPFVTAIREYKVLLELLAAEVCEAHGDASFAESAVPVRSELLRQLAAMLKATLDVNTLAERSGAAAVLSEKERSILSTELQWLQEQRAQHKESEHTFSMASPMDETSSSVENSNLLERNAGQARRKERKLVAPRRAIACVNVSPQQRSATRAIPVSDKVSPVARTTSIEPGNAEDMGVAQSTATGSQLKDNILLQYFENRLSDLPPFQFVQRGGDNGVRVAARPNLKSKLKEELIATQGTSERRCEEAEAALRESHKRIAALEKLTDKLSETVLTHRLSATLANELDAMQGFLHVTADICAEFTLQKSLLFADEMAELVRQAERNVYGVPRRFAVRGALPVAAKGYNEPREEAEGEKLMNDCAAEGLSLFPPSLVLKPLVNLNPK